MTSFVYIIAIGGDDGPFDMPVKIGMTDNPERRLAEIRPHSPLGVSFAFVYEAYDRSDAATVEKEMHKIFKERRLAYEWFAVPPNEAIETLGRMTGHLK